MTTTYEANIKRRRNTQRLSQIYGNIVDVYDEREILLIGEPCEMRVNNDVLGFKAEKVRTYLN